MCSRSRLGGGSMLCGGGLCLRRQACGGGSSLSLSLVWWQRRRLRRPARQPARQQRPAPRRPCGPRVRCVLSPGQRPPGLLWWQQRLAAEPCPTWWCPWSCPPSQQCRWQCRRSPPLAPRAACQSLLCNQIPPRSLKKTKGLDWLIKY